MTEEQINKVVENRRKIDALNDVKQVIGDEECTRLSYIEDLGTQKISAWNHISLLKLSPIEYILKKHDRMIRQEIDERITELKKELEAL